MDLNSGNLMVLKVEKSKIRLPADSVPGESPLSGLQSVTFLRNPHTADRQTERVLASPDGALTLSNDLYLRLSSKLNYFLKTPFQIISNNVRILTYEWQGWGDNQSTATYSLSDLQQVTHPSELQLSYL